MLFRLVPSRQRMDGDRQHDRPDEEVDEEHPAPAVLRARELHDQAAEQRPDRRGDADDPAEVAECPAAVPPGEQTLDDRADRRVVDARAQPLQEAGGDQLRGVAGDAAGHAGHGEQGQPSDEEPLVAEPVADPARRHQREAERQRVAGDDPLQRVRGRVGALLDARQGHVHDRGVQHGHEGAGQHDRENPPFPVARVAHRRPLPGQPRLKRPQTPHRTRSFAAGTPGQPANLS